MTQFLNGTDPGLRQTRTPTVDTFAAGVGFTAGSSTYVTLTVDCGTEASLITTFDGITQHRDTYSYDTSNRRVTFDAAIPTGVAKIECTYTTTIPATTPADGSVTQAKLGGEAVNESKLQVSNAPTNGQFLSAQSGATGGLTWAAPAGGGFASMQVFTSSGTWTKPTDIKLVKVYVIGGGGGGAGGAAGPTYGQGGGGGGGAMEVIDVSSVSTVTVTVGAGGSGGNSAVGSAGATSSFGSYCSATGGAGGIYNSNDTLTDGGAGTGGTINMNGQEGGWADWDQQSGANYQGGDGGDAPFGFGLGGLGGTSAGSSAIQCQDGNGYGSGGGGGQGSGSNNGGEGGGGIVVVEEFK